MSQICKYYLRGTCRYGFRCRFIHEEPRYDSRADFPEYSYNNYSSRSYQHNYSNQQGYSDRERGFSNRDYPQHYSHKDYYQTYPKEVYNRHPNKEYSHVSNRDYYRYHVDHRQDQKNSRNAVEISAEELLDVIQSELDQFEKQHIWLLTVIAPIKGYGNIPGFKDYSPEEVRYQYYEAVRNNTLFNFEQNMKQIQENIMRCCQILKSKSLEAFDIVKTMLRNANQNVEKMATDNMSSAASTFSFDLKKLQDTASCGDCSQTTFTPFVGSSVPTFQSAHTDSTFSTNNKIVNNSWQSSIFSSQPSNQNCVATCQSNSQSSVMNSFSFNLRNLPQVNEGVLNNSVYLQNVSEDVYSKSEDLSPEILGEFQAKTFTLGRVPLVPPPRELCVG